jgi:hypothetical protein
LGNGGRKINTDLGLVEQEHSPTGNDADDAIWLPGVYTMLVPKFIRTNIFVKHLMGWIIYSLLMHAEPRQQAGLYI